jgi:hypothetical protein
VGIKPMSRYMSGWNFVNTGWYHRNPLKMIMNMSWVEERSLTTHRNTVRMSDFHGHPDHHGQAVGQGKMNNTNTTRVS